MRSGFEGEKKTDQGRNIFSSSEWPSAPMRAVPRVAIAPQMDQDDTGYSFTSVQSPLGKLCQAASTLRAFRQVVPTYLEAMET